jgi:hypothetical protein
MTTKANKPITLDALPPGSVVELQGKQYPTHSGLLALAHAHGLESIKTDLLNYSDSESIVKATVTGTRGTYEAHGDASPGNVSRNIANATIRMGETRAINRALRSYLGIGATTAEELPPDAFQGRASGNTRKAPQKPAQRKQSPAVAAAESTVASGKFGKGDTVQTSKGNVGTIFWIGGDNGDRVGVAWGETDDEKEWTYLRFCREPEPQNTPDPEPVSDDEIPF